MKFIMMIIGILVLSGCDASSGPGKEAAPMMDVSSQLPVLTGSDVWKMDKAQSKLGFVAVHKGREFEGEFSNFDAAIKLDPSNPQGGEIHAVIDLSSVDAGDRDRNANLPNKDWFHIESFPIATFSSADITPLDGDNYQAAGTLVIKGISKPVPLVFSLQIDGDNAVAIGGADLIRTDFNLGQGPDFSGEDWVKFPVAVKLNIKASR